MSSLLLIPVFILGMFVWAAILHRWRLGLYALVIYTPFTGLVVSAFAPSPVGNLVRDLLIVIPLYLAFLLTRRQSDRMVLPPGFVTLVAALALLVTISAALGGTGGTLVALLGAKVWLFYIPLVAIGAAYLRDRNDLVALLRLFVVMGWIPCGVGLLMFVGAISYDYKASVELLYGEFARNATQNFAAFKVGESTLYRIPGTFQFAAQYSGFCLFMLFPVLMQVRLDQSRRWRAFGYVTLVLVIAAALTSGSRGAFLHLPFLFAVIGALRFGFGRGGNAMVVFAFIVFGGVVLWQFDESAVIEHVAQLAAMNGRYIVVGGLEFAIEHGGLLGQGVGVGTVATRHVMADASLFAAIENYYAKAWMELGLPGFVVVLLLFVYLLVVGLQTASRIRDNALRDAGLTVVALIVFVIYISTRGWPLDQDPLAYYFWLMVGLLLKLPYLEAARAGRPVAVGPRSTVGGYAAPSPARR
ncbi:MAG: hypothetical protein AB7R90_13900 [Reyranellaceae bacterium]